MAEAKTCDCTEVTTSFDFANLIGTNSFTKTVGILGAILLILQIVLNDSLADQPSTWWYTLTRFIVSFLILLLLLQIVACATTRVACPFVGALFILLMVLSMIAYIVQVCVTSAMTSTNAFI